MCEWCLLNCFRIKDTYISFMLGGCSAILIQTFKRKACKNLSLSEEMERDHSHICTFKEVSMSSKKRTEFSELITNKELLSYLESVSMTLPTQVQVESIPRLMGAGHFTIQSRTGTGKTLAYLLPVISRLKALEAEDDSTYKASPKAVIIAPTRELALQIFKVAKGMSHFAKLRIRKLVGGDKGKSLKNMFSMPMDILVTTPDRCFRSFKNKELSMESLRFLVLDEADQLLEPSFRKTMRDLTYLIKKDDVQIFLVSASRPGNFNELIKEFFQGKKLEPISVGEQEKFSHKVTIYNVSLDEVDKFKYIQKFVRKQSGRNGLIFMGNKARAQRLSEELQSVEHQIHLLHKDLDIKERVAVSDQFKSQGGIMIATDIFARGIDIPHLEWVLNFDIPSEPYYYLHRCGRVGRAGRAGDVYNFITSNDNRRLQSINKALVKQSREELHIDMKTTRRTPKKKKNTSKKKK